MQGNRCEPYRANRPDLIGDPDGPQTRDRGSTPRRSGRRAAPSGGRRRGPSATCGATIYAARLLAGRCLGLQAHPLRRWPRRRAARGGRQPLQPCESGKSEWGGRGAGERQPRRRESPPRHSAMPIRRGIFSSRLRSGSEFSQIPSSKSQAPTKSQLPRPKESWKLGSDWRLIGIWDLGFGA